MKVYKRGGHWWCRFPDGARKSLKIPKDTTQRQAERYAMEVWRAPQDTAVDVGAVAFSGLAAVWLDLAKKKVVSTQADHKVTWKKHLKPWWGDGDTRVMTALDIEQFQQSKLDNGYSPGYVNRLVRSIRSILQVGVRGEYLDKNVGKAVKDLSYSPAWDWYTLDETALFLNEVEPEWKAFFTTGFRCGLRPGELRALKWEDVDLSNAEIQVVATEDHHGRRPPKNKHARAVPIPSDALEVLKDQQARTRLKSEYVFGEWDGGSVRSLSAIDRAMKRIAKRVGLRPLRPHWMRHSYASQLVNRGVQISIVARLLGHADVSTTFKTYAHLAPDTLAGSVELLANPKNGTKSVQNKTKEPGMP